MSNLNIKKNIVSSFLTQAIFCIYYNNLQGSEPKTPEKKEKKKEKLPELTVESFLDIPLPKLHTASGTSKTKATAKHKASLPEQSNNAEKAKDSNINVKDEKLTKAAVEKGQSKVVDETVTIKKREDKMDDDTHAEEAAETVVSNEASNTVRVDEMTTDQEEAGKTYHFAWEKVGSDNMSEVTISSVHTSDLSSFEDEDSSQSEPGDESEAEEVTGEVEGQGQAEAQLNEKAGNGSIVFMLFNVKKHAVVINLLSFNCLLRYVLLNQL